ncbi:MAG: WcaF family extracellular polysaccharide biosynthesis acetyltransferase [Phycisphaeraceae bacterium]
MSRVDSPEPRFEQRHASTWSAGTQLRRLLWALVQATLFRWSFHTMNGWRALLLRRFGAKVGRACVIRRTVNIEMPWHLDMADHVCLGDHCILYCLGPVKIHPRVTISQYSHLCAGTHDHTRRDLPLVTAPIEIESEVWIGADVFVGPGVRIGQRSVVGARASVFKDLPADQVCVGTPARPIKPRVLE